MEKIIEALKRFGVWLKKPIGFIVKSWAWFIKLVSTQWFLLTFPTAVFTVVMIATWSLLMLLALVIWVIVIIRHTDDEI